MAPLRYDAKFDPFLSLDCAPAALLPSVIHGKEGMKFCHLATLLVKSSRLLQALSFTILFLYRFGGSPGWDKTMWLTTNSKGGINSDAEFFFGATANGMCMHLLVQTIGAVGGDKSFFTVSGN